MPDYLPFGIAVEVITASMRIIQRWGSYLYPNDMLDIKSVHIITTLSSNAIFPEGQG